MRLRLRRSLLGWVVLASCFPVGAAHGEAAEGEAGPEVAAGVPVTIELWNLGPASTVTVAFDNARFLGEAVADEGSAPVLAGLTLDGSNLAFAVPPGTLPDGTYSNLVFSVGMELAVGAGGRVATEAPVVVVIRTPYGDPVLQTGPFELDVRSAPPTCALAGCGPGHETCPPDAEGRARQCYGYMGQFYCCVDPPYSEI